MVSEVATGEVALAQAFVQEGSAEFSVEGEVDVQRADHDDLFPAAEVDDNCTEKADASD